MTTAYVLPLADARATLEVAGGKGASLARLCAAGLPVPGGFHVTTSAYRRFVEANGLQAGILSALATTDASRPAALEAVSGAIGALFAAGEMPADVAGALAGAYAAMGAPAVAVRSSATAEDLPGLSFAGQQETFLNVRGDAAVLDAVRRCWASLWSARAIGYRAQHGIAQHGIAQEDVALAVVVQALVPADAAGILFTADPLSGRRDEVVISAAWGLGEAIVSGAVTPDTLAVEKATGGVRRRETADKAVMSVRAAGGVEEGPVPADLRRAAVLSDEAAARLAQFGVQIEALYGVPMDVEWALSGGDFAILQARPITALPEEQEMLADEWPLPRPGGLYARASIAELMPAPLSPLFESMVIPRIAPALGEVFHEFIGAAPDTYPLDYIAAINGFVYLRVNYTAAELWHMAQGFLPHLGKTFRGGVPFWQNVVYPRYARVAARWQDRALGDLTAPDLLAGARELAAAFTQHLATLMMATMGASAGSEALFSAVYGKVVRRPGDPDAAVFLMGFDSKPIRAEKALYDLAQWCRRRPALAGQLAAVPAGQVAAAPSAPGAPAGVPAADWDEWRARLGDYLRDYGYAIYNLDFACALPADDPAALIETLKMYLSGGGKSPHQRQADLAGRREAAVQAVRARLKRGPRRWAFEKALAYAQWLAPLREEGLAEIGLAYPALRRVLRELGGRLVAAGALERAEDIFWLQSDEVQQAADALARNAAPGLGDVARRRAAQWRARARLAPPSRLPRKAPLKVLGINFDRWIATHDEDEQGEVLKGIPASPGRVTARARVLRGPEDFEGMRPGEVLVAAITTPAWTPLFAMAAAVVTDIGGPLSHSSIVAREYGIPAVLGTGVASKRIRSGQLVTVDGSSGTVTLVAGQDAQP